MQTIALAAWQGGDTRVVSEQGFTSAIKLARAENAWENFKKDNGSDVTNLAMNFYLKAAETGQRGFEFTHKSFGDYLAARAILDIAVELPVFINRRVDHAMTDWIEATGSGTLSNEILNFLREEVRLRTTNSSEANALEENRVTEGFFRALHKHDTYGGASSTSGCFLLAHCRVTTDKWRKDGLGYSKRTKPGDCSWETTRKAGLCRVARQEDIFPKSA